jgi:hypothetical protein
MLIDMIDTELKGEENKLVELISQDMGGDDRGSKAQMYRNRYASC